MNVHKRCQKNVANNCGINTKEMAEILNAIGVNTKINQRKKKVNYLSTTFVGSLNISQGRIPCWDKPHKNGRGFSNECADLRNCPLNFRVMGNPILTLWFVWWWGNKGQNGVAGCGQSRIQNSSIYTILWVFPCLMNRNAFEFGFGINYYSRKQMTRLSIY